MRKPVLVADGEPVGEVTPGEVVFDRVDARGARVTSMFAVPAPATDARPRSGSFVRRSQVIDSKGR